MKLILFLFLNYFNSILIINSLNTFSGLYTPNLKYSLEVYSASWLQNKKNYLNNLKYIKDITSLESTSTGALMRYEINRRFILMSRDYFDFEIEHLSSTTNVIGDNKYIVTYLTQITKRKALWLKKIASNIPNTPSFKPFMNITVVIIPFSTKSASSGVGQVDHSQQLRVNFFEATFWSIYRYMPHIAIAVSNQRDADFVNELQLPIFELYKFEKDGGVAWELPKFSLLKAHEALSSDPRWAHFQYIYFTEGDQILHMRHQTDILKFLQATDGKFSIVPHRMQTMILPKTLPEDLKKHISDEWRHKVTENAELYIENSTVITGSCCDDGRWKFADCGNWWYHCPRWGFANMSTWLKIGKTGFTMPTTTEHLGRCKYSPTRQVCPIPPNCKHRIPHEMSDVCDEIDHIN